MKKLSLNVSNIYHWIKKDFQRLVFSSGFFFLMKMSSFLAALWFSNLVSTADFGLFEYALSFGIIAAVPLNLGMHGAYPFFNIRQQREGFQSLFYFHVLWVIGGIVGLLLVDVFFLAQLSMKIHIAMLVACVIAMQSLYATILKSHEILIPAILLDGGLLLSINVYNAYLYFGGNDFYVDTLWYLLLSYVVLLYGIYCFRFWQLKADFAIKRYIEAINFGKYLVLSAFLIIFLTGGARILIDYFLGIEQVAYYGFYFRFAMLTVMLHQIVNIVFFRKMYRAEVAKLDRYFSIFIAAILVLSLCLWWSIPRLFIDSFSLLAESIETYNSLYFILSFQVVFWIILALNENIVYREELSSIMNKGLSVVLVLMLGLSYAFYQFDLLDIFNLSIINMLCIFLACEYQFFILKKHKAIQFAKTRFLSLLSLVLFISGYFLI